MRDVYNILAEVIHELNMENEDELSWLNKQIGNSIDDAVSKSKKESLEVKHRDRDPVTDQNLSIEKRLYLYEINYLKTATGNGERLKNLLLHSIGNIRRVQKIHQALQIAEMSPPLHQFLIFSPFWIRDPLTWSDLDSRDLFEHLFSEYCTPRYFQGMWYQNRNNVNRKWLVWHILLMQGGSLKKASNLFGWNLYSKFQHHLVQNQDGMSFEELIAYSEALRLGNNIEVARSISLNPAFAIDITETSLDPSFVRFWYETAHWLNNNYFNLEQNEMAPILEWAMHKFTEANREGKQFSWKGRTPNNVVDLSAEYQSERMIIGDELQWKPHGMDWSYQPDRLKSWLIKEITSASELYQEGKRMNHCVGMYLQDCLSKKHAIFSMVFNQINVATIQLDLRKKCIVQALGPMNSLLNKDQKEILDKWLREAVLHTKPVCDGQISVKTQKLLRENHFESVYAYNELGNTLLHEMVKRGEKEIVEHLLTDIEPDVTNMNDETPLMIAVREECLEMIRILKNAKPKHTLMKYPGDCILFEAIKRENTLIVDELFNNYSIVSPEFIYKVATLKRPFMLKYFLRKGANINAADSIDRTALNFAIEKKDGKTIRRLFKYGAKLDLMSYLAAQKWNFKKKFYENLF